MLTRLEVVCTRGFHPHYENVHGIGDIVRYAAASEGQTMLSLASNAGTHIKGTITSFGDGISILEEESVSRITMQVRWTVTESVKKTQASDQESGEEASSQSTTPITRYALKESTVFSGFLLQAWFHKMHHGHTAHAELLIGLLNKITAQECSSMQVLPITIKRQDSGYEEPKVEQGLSTN